MCHDVTESFLRGAIQKALNETFSADVPIRFETAPDLVSGIELSTSLDKVVELVSTEGHSRYQIGRAHV